CSTRIRVNEFLKEGFISKFITGGQLIIQSKNRLAVRINRAWNVCPIRVSEDWLLFWYND
ncbi:MAG: hypothetical protein ACXWV5_08640, partial [Flavitalea sp.]